MASVQHTLPTAKNDTATFVTGPPTDVRPLHYLESVRRRERISQRTVSRRLGIDMATVREQERESADIPLSVLYQWQSVLDVPLIELLVEPDDSLSPPIAKRAHLLRLMKTVLSILERSNEMPVKRMAETMINQLAEIMPELREVNAWHVYGPRSSRNEYGRAAEHTLPDSMFPGGEE
jgi:transcriptional regulator with XRE-family HTH domain